MQLWHLKHGFLRDGESLMSFKKCFVAMHSRQKRSFLVSVLGAVEIYSEIDHDDITSREVECFFDGRQLDRLS